MKVLRTLVFGALATASASTGEAQLVQSTGDGQVDGLTQLAIQATSTGATARLQALELFVTKGGRKSWRFWINTQLPLRSTGQDDPGESTGGRPEPSEFLKMQLADEHGGLLNMSLGHYGRIWTARDANPLIEEKDRPGLLLDARGGLKLIELPGDDGDTASLFTAISPFWTGTVSLSFELPLYNGDDSVAGGLRFGLTAAGSYAGDADFQTAFATPLTRGLGHVRAHALLTIPNLGELELSGLLRSSDPFASKRLMVALHARRK